MTYQEAINVMQKYTGDDTISPVVQEAHAMGIDAMKKQEKYETQWHDDMGNPLEPIKITSALNSEIMKLEYRKEHRPKDISILDYTVIAALMECLEKRTEDINDGTSL